MKLVGLLTGWMLFGVFCPAPLCAETGLLYQTTFEEFPVGPNQWAGNEGWFSNPEAEESGIQGIDENIVLGIGKSAFLGASTPASRWNYVARVFDHDSEVEGSALIEIDTLLGVQDSTNGQHDSFFVSIYNTEGFFLAALQFTNEEQKYQIWRDDGSVLTDTTVNFIPGELQLLVLQIDLVGNRWSAEHDGIPLFTDETFTNSGRDRNLGSLAYEWLVTAVDPANHGDNWMLVADCEVWAVPRGAPEVDVSLANFSTSGEPGLEFIGEPGWTYRIEYSDDFSEWKSDLPDSVFTVTDFKKSLRFTDETSGDSRTRYYRVSRTVTP